jgi:hypothetical protein
LQSLKSANTESIYDSYLRFTAGEEHLDRQTVMTRLNALKGASCGNILIRAERRGWYQFRESMMQGYVRLRAEEQGVELATDYTAAGTNNAPFGWRARGARRSPMTTVADWNKTREPTGI